VVIGTDCTGSCKSNFHTIMTMTALIWPGKSIPNLIYFLHAWSNKDENYFSNLRYIFVSLKFKMFYFHFFYYSKFKVFIFYIFQEQDKKKKKKNKITLKSERDNDFNVDKIRNRHCDCELLSTVLQIALHHDLLIKCLPCLLNIINILPEIMILTILTKTLYSKHRSSFSLYICLS
jgi:hypothetical protein